MKYDYINNNSTLLIYPKGQIELVNIIIEAKYVNGEEYIFDEISDLTNFNYSNKETNKNYLMIKGNVQEKNKYILISIETKKETTIELTTLLYKNNTITSIAPFSPNLIYIRKGEFFLYYYLKIKRVILYLI